jgi:hypothetical protein
MSPGSLWLAGSHSPCARELTTLTDGIQDQD